METFAEDGEHVRVLIGPRSAKLRRAKFTRVWVAAPKKANLHGFHFHDLRHVGNALAAQTGATLRDLMTRMGHSSTRAVLITRKKASAVCTRPASR